LIFLVLTDDIFATSSPPCTMVARFALLLQILATHWPLASSLFGTPAWPGRTGVIPKALRLKGQLGIARRRRSQQVFGAPAHRMTIRSGAS
jgi:hypothetical protein